MTKTKILNTIKYSIQGHTARITLHRPEIHNAFNEVMISELLNVYRELGRDESVRVVLLTGEGKSFCAGADLKWMKGVIDYSYEQNLHESLQLAELFYTMYSLPKPTIVMVNGAAIGGGTGMVAVNDIVIASDRALFSLSEVKIGLVPACISPYVIRKIGENRSRELFLTGDRIDAERSLAIGLANAACSHDDLESTACSYIEKLISSGPNALKICKEMLEKVPQFSLRENIKYTADTIARLRISDEGQEGMKAFFEKRDPNWLVN